MPLGRPVDFWVEIQVLEVLFEEFGVDVLEWIVVLPCYEHLEYFEDRGIQGVGPFLHRSLLYCLHL